MKKSAFALAVILSFALPAAAQQSFFLTGGLGADYQKQTYTLGLARQDYSELSERAYVDFSSAFWSWDLLRYTLSLSASRSDVDAGGAKDVNHGLGYGVRFHLFPLSRNQFQVAAGHNTYDFSREASPGYTQKSDYLHLRGIMQGWALTVDRTSSKTDGPYPDQRLDEDADLNKVWNVGAGIISLDARRDRTAQDFFGTEILQQSVALHGDQHFSPDHNFWFDAIYRSYRYSDTPLELESSNNYGTTNGQWRLKTGPLWETQAYLSTLMAGGQNAEDMQWLNRFFVSSPVSMDVTTGYFISRRDGVGATYPYYGAGLYYADTQGAWTTQMQGGYMVFMGDAQKGTPDSRSPYGLAALSLNRESGTFSLSAQYNGTKEQILAPSPVEGSPFQQAQASLTTDNFLARLDLVVRMGYTGSLRLESYENTYKQTGIGEDRNVRDITHQLDLFLPHGSIGVRIADEDQYSSINPSRFHSRDLHAAYGFTSHLTLRGYYIWRDKRISGKSVKEREGYAALDYAIGKFTLRSTYQILRSDDVSQAEHSQFVVSLLRRFGNE